MKTAIAIVSMVMILGGVSSGTVASVSSFAKVDGVPGPAKSKPSSATAASKKKIDTSKPQPVGMLLPAVQSVREAAPSANKSKGTVEATRKVEEGTAHS